MLTLLILTYASYCEETITKAFHFHLMESKKTHYELFQEFDCDKNNCIDSYEINKLLKEIGVPWSCRWPEKVIREFDTVNVNNCIEWQEFKIKLREFTIL